MESQHHHVAIMDSSSLQNQTVCPVRQLHRKEQESQLFACQTGVKEQKALMQSKVYSLRT